MNPLSATLKQQPAKAESLVFTTLIGAGRGFGIAAAQRRFQKHFAEQRVSSVDKAKLLEVRKHLLRHDFDAAAGARLFALLAPCWRDVYATELDAESAWAAFLMLKGRGVAVSGPRQRREALLLAAAGAALAEVPLHWLLADEARVAQAAAEAAPLFHALGLPPIATDTTQNPRCLLTTPQRLAHAYLQDRAYFEAGRLGALFERVEQPARGRLPPFSLLLVEHMDFWLLEKAFAGVESEARKAGLPSLQAWNDKDSRHSGKSQITLHELFQRYTRRGGTLLGAPDSALRRDYAIPVRRIGKQPATEFEDVCFYPDAAGKRQALREHLRKVQREKTPLLVLAAGAESLQDAETLCKALDLDYAGCAKLDAAAVGEAFTAHPLVLVHDAFPWLRVEDCAAVLECSWLVLDFYPSARFLYHISHSQHAARMSLMLSAQDAWLKDVPEAVRSLPAQRPVQGKAALKALQALCAGVERQRKKLHGDISLWLRQIEKLFTPWR